VDEREKRLIGEGLEPAGGPKAPRRGERFQRVGNTLKHAVPDDWDRLGTGEKATAWLREKGFAVDATPSEAQRLRAFRETLRGLIVGREVVLRADVTLAVDHAGARLEPVAGGVDGVMAALLAIVQEAQLSGDWSRMKGCRQCEYAFYDRSKNRSATWCAMSICGNRTKNRAYYRRRRGG
jgi:predicted RNA-binding Zn ribbon-like protein